MGGQALGQDTLHLDMTHMDTVRYDDSDQTIIVGPGATWRQVQTVLSQHGRAVRVMQDSNIFSVGGSLSVNVHGKDPRYGSLIESVKYLKVVTMDGQEIRCDRTQNQDLFAAVIGGYGLLGIITEVSLLTTPNSAYAFSLIPTETTSLLDRLDSMSKDPEMGLLEAHLSVDADRFLSESLIYAYAETTILRTTSLTTLLAKTASGCARSSFKRHERAILGNTCAGNWKSASPHSLKQRR